MVVFGIHVGHRTALPSVVVRKSAERVGHGVSGPCPGCAGPETRAKSAVRGAGAELAKHLSVPGPARNSAQNMAAAFFDCPAGRAGPAAGGPAITVTKRDVARAGPDQPGPARRRVTKRDGFAGPGATPAPPGRTVTSSILIMASEPSS
ncbi:uncharacterized protein A4U43_C07F1010 [Asparagus officinalis]|uniref:Uncharacterized protein n=1 Tax=Asparagus officinalis TaxID=4686 RepID=A0A5P1EDC3_ASPOF|nr:uncharacterized protein A4U43_C07F1010 [Asparagus officinalis]